MILEHAVIIHEARTIPGVTLAKLAKLSGLSRSTVQRILRGAGLSKVRGERYWRPTR